MYCEYVFYVNYFCVTVFWEITCITHNIVNFEIKGLNLECYYFVGNGKNNQFPN